MAWARIATVGENWTPLAQIVVEAFDLDNPNVPLTTATSDNGGMVLFLGLPNNKRYFFKPRVVRAAGSYGSATQYGIVNLQILQTSAMTCADAYVEPSGQWGTDKTIQAAVDRLTATVGPVQIFVQGGVYNESVSITSATAQYTFVGCSPYVIDWPADTSSTAPTTPLGAAINGGTSFAVDFNTASSCIFVGIEITNGAGAIATIKTSAAGKLRLIDCEVINSLAGGCILGAGGVAQLRLEHCVINATLASDAVNLGASATSVHIENSWIVGRVIIPGVAGFVLTGSSVQASNATQVLAPGASKGRVFGNYIWQKGAGDGISITGGGIGWEITGNQIDGGGHAVSTNAINVGAACHVSITGNIINGWAVGVIANVTAVINGDGNEYSDITTYLSGVPTTGSISLDGLWITVPYTAGDFVATTGVLTVDAGDLIDLSYCLHGHTMTLSWIISTATLSLNTTTVTIKIPNGQTAKRAQANAGWIFDNGVQRAGRAFVTTGATVVTIAAMDGSAIVAGANNVYLQGEITFAV